MKPVIDVHAHLFNARDIPLEGYLLSRDYKGGLERFLIRMLIPLVARCIRGELNRKKKGNILSKTICDSVLDLAYRATGQQYREWANTLSKEIEQITCEMLKTYEDINLYVPLMIDYEYWFKNTPDTPIKEQIKRIYQKVVLPNGGTIHPFVPFDPARELAFRKGMDNPDGKPEEDGSLQLVKDAIENKGFIGVKLYNSLGYKPFKNQSVDDKRRRIPLHKRKYVFKGEEYDEVLSELYDYCVENEVPITAHCVMEGIESYPKASWDFGEAILWHEVLWQNKYRNLHLNLAHFGWHLQQGYGGSDSWVRDICEMLEEYQFVFTDVSHHRVVSDLYSTKFKVHYKRICSDYPVVKKKLLFGIDWHVIKRIRNFSNFKGKYVEVLKHDNLFTDKEIEDFLGGNAMRFLGLLPGRRKNNRKRLKEFYEKNGIDPPDWFKSTGTSKGEKA
jgi:predicted TIM-barrel fold metal-dependent hydrolase